MKKNKMRNAETAEGKEKKNAEINEKYNQCS